MKRGCNMKIFGRVLKALPSWYVSTSSFHFVVDIVRTLPTFQSNQPTNYTNRHLKFFKMKFSHLAVIAASSLVVSAQDSSTGGGLFSSITNAGTQ